MKLLKNDKPVALKIRSLIPHQVTYQVLIVLGLAFSYIAIFWLFIDSLGPHVSIYLIVPIFMSGLYFGPRVGLITSFLGLALNSLLLAIFGNYTLAMLIPLWPGFLVIILVGFFAGYLRNELAAREYFKNEESSRERFISLVTMATNNIVGSKELEDAYFYLTSHLTNLFVADYAYLIHWDDENKYANLVATTAPLEESMFPLPLRPEEANLIKTALETRSPISIEDVQRSSYVINPASFGKIASQAKSAIILPLRTENYCFGAVILVFDYLRRFTPEENVYVELAGNQVTLALRTFEQQLAIETQLNEAQALARIERALSESERVGVDKVLQLIVDSAMELIPNANGVILHLLDNKKQILVPRSVAGFTEKTKEKLNMRPGEGIAGQVMSTEKMIRIADVRNDPRFLGQATPVKFRSLVVAPIKSHDDCIGTISIQSDVANAFSNSEVSLLETLGTQVSIGIDNANLLETLELRVQQRTHDLVVLYNLITIISENWQLQDLLELSLILTLETVKADRGIIYLVDGKETLELKPIVQRGFADGFQIEMGSLPDDDLAQAVLEQHKPIAFDDLADKPTYAKFKGMNSYAGIPILARGNVRGVFSLFAKDKNLFSTDKMALLASIADHLGIGIENSILWEQSRENAALEERNRLARNLHDSVTQQLYSLTLMAGTTKKLLERNPDPDTIKKSVARLGETAHQALKEMRLLLYELRPAVLDSEGLASALQHRVETVEERLGVKVDLQAKGLPDLPSDIEDALYHIALEALNNVVKHSGSTTAIIRFAKDEENIVMEISDNGKGFDTNRSHVGLGLRNMRERGQMLGGEVEIISTPGEGTLVRVKVRAPGVSFVES